ncbi:MAG: type II toxin-antitoxin system RelE/ParE family toxin [Bacteroidales bacterium]|nr:type II toxin-antitoxin system RelE/ParE family toxin [Bacteroidales bacterium]
MKTFKVIVSNDAVSDIDEIAAYVAGLYRPESGHRYINRILGQLASLSYTANIYRHSSYLVAKNIHPNARTLPIINHRWTVIFHIEQSYVMIDRILLSKMMR